MDGDTLGSPDGCGCERELSCAGICSHGSLTQRLMLGCRSLGKTGWDQPVMFQIVGVFHDIQNSDHLDGQRNNRRCSCACGKYRGRMWRWRREPASTRARLTSSIRSALAVAAPQSGL